VAVFTDAERMEVWDRRQAGELNRSIGHSLGRTGASIRALMGRSPSSVLAAHIAGYGGVPWLIVSRCSGDARA
jgi:hypothetical protein